MYVLQTKCCFQSTGLKCKTSCWYCFNALTLTVHLKASSQTWDQIRHSRNFHSLTIMSFWIIFKATLIRSNNIFNIFSSGFSTAVFKRQDCSNKPFMVLSAVPQQAFVYFGLILMKLIMGISIGPKMDMWLDE